MKGHLYKKLQPEGWYVAYTSDEVGFQKTELPLHPEYVKYYFLDEDADGSEVEFDWCVIVDHDSGKGKEYAKLIRPKEQTNGERFDEFMKTVQKGILVELMELDSKDGLYHASPQAEISDEEIEKRADEYFKKHIDDMGFYGFIDGAKWYREQLKSRQ